MAHAPAAPASASVVRRFLREQGFHGLCVRTTGANTANLPQDSVLISCDWQDLEQLAKAADTLRCAGGYYVTSAIESTERWVAVVGGGHRQGA